jgi:copper transport protein
LGVLLALGYRVAEAHTRLLSSEPAADSHLTVRPTRVRLVFSEPIEATLGTISITGSDGRGIRLAAAGDAHDVHALVAPMDALAAGSYRVSWRVVSADGHPVSGTFAFTLASESMPLPAALPPPEAAPQVDSWGPSAATVPLIPALLRGVGVGFLMALTGLLAFLVRMRAAIDSRPGAAARYLALGAALGLAAHLVAWALNASPDHRLNMTTLTTTTGQVELVRVAAAVLAVWAVWLARRPAVGLVFAVIAVAVSGAVGHAAAIYPMFTIPTKAIHLLAVSAWMGGLLWVVLRESDDLPRYVAEANWMSSIALPAVIVVAFTGIVEEKYLLGSWIDFVRSDYGIIALAKAAGLIVLVGFGAYHRYRALPTLDQSTMPLLRSSVKREVFVFSLVVLLGGLLAYMPLPGPVE